MPGTLHVFDFIKTPSADIPRGLCPVFGNERFLQNLAVATIRTQWGGDDSEFSVSNRDGNQCSWADVMDELSTRSLFDSEGTKIVVLDDADGFVKQHRSELESFATGRQTSGVLVLVVSSWASNTKLYKHADKNSLQIQCDAPIIKRGRSKQRDDNKTSKWLVERAESKYGYHLPPVCAGALIELTESNFGRMDQELGKLGLYIDPNKDLTPLEVRKIVGGWPAQTMWSAIDAALDGQAGQALDMLHQLFIAGEHPLAMFGQISWSLRRYAEVGELVQSDSRNRRRIHLPDSLKAAGFRSWGNEIELANSRLKQLGRKRVAELLDWIVDIDHALKRSHSKEERGRLKLELLFTKMAEQLGPQAPAR